MIQNIGTTAVYDRGKPQELKVHHPEMCYHYRNSIHFWHCFIA